ncbi:MAG: efflux RND transporter periplasmic adaptor subunit [Bacteroidetes bacterium]|nr:efflux RND transporter periplasmic adaptor subunit [Bacteroidota bacterium]
MSLFSTGSKILFRAATTISISLIACKDKTDPSSKPKSNPPTVVDIIVAAPQSITNHIEVNGTVVANEYVELHPEANGRLIYLNVPEGRMVKAGTIIARVNDADLKAQIQKSKVQLDLAQKTEERYKQLIAVNGINQSDYDAALNVVNGYKADIEYTQALLDKTVVKAPFDGIVGLRQVSLGAFVSTATMIATMQQLNKIKIDFTLPEEYGNILKIGGLVDVETDNTTQVRKKATILAIEPQVNQTTRNIKVRAILQTGKANPGGFVKVYVDAGEDKNALMVPTNCIIPDDKNKQLVVVKNGKAEFMNVQTGLRQANNVEITSGIKTGDSVVVTGTLFARPKSPVKIRKVMTLDKLAKASE